MSVGPILNTIELDHCWVCRRRFIECDGNDPSVIRNRHHVVPQANGGKDGPTVTLCSAHHDLLHAVATQVLAGNPHEPLLNGIEGEECQRVLYLSAVVVRSTKAVVNDPNKSAQVMVHLDGEHRRMLTRLARTDKLSQPNELLALIEREYHRRFPSITVS